MTAPVHTYGPTCLLYEPESTPSTVHSDDIIPPPPKLRSQFFYLSSLPIDDPLTPVPAPTNGPSSAAKLPPRPFSVRDNIALEEAWQGLRSAAEDTLACGDDELAGGSQDHPLSVSDDDEASDSIDGKQKENTRAPLKSGDDSGTCRKKGMSISHPPRQSPSGLEIRVPARRSRGVSDVEESQRKRYSAPLERTSKSVKRKSTSSPTGEERRLTDSSNCTPRAGRQSVDLSVSGSPFLRAPIRERSNALSPSPSTAATTKDGIRKDREESPTPASKRDHATTGSQQEQDEDRNQSRPPSATSEIDVDATVTVGASRLHLVELPNLKVGFHHY